MPKIQIFILLFAVMTLVGMDYLHAAWTAPTNNPPSGNIATPVNTGSSSQVKTGALSLGALSVVGDSQFDGDIKFPFKNTSSNTMTEWNMRANDGSGNFNIYLNSNGGSSPTYLSNGYALRVLFNPNQGSYIFKGSQTSGNTGAAVAWQDIFKIFQNGSIGADQYCDVDGNNCTAASTNASAPQVGIINNPKPVGVASAANVTFPQKFSSKPKVAVIPIAGYNDHWCRGGSGMLTMSPTNITKSGFSVSYPSYSAGCSAHYVSSAIWIATTN